ncbi:MAG: CoA pyrophosphatase [Bacteroidia bacterium]|nr:CoA pyrophosphatase [Bacteroidia bacterium]
MTLDQLAAHLQQGLAGPLPGFEAHRQLFPKTQAGEVRYKPPVGAPKTSSVLVLALPGASGAPELVFTLRSAQLGSHGGQISFPGGRIEAEETPEMAALREAEEEVGLPATAPTVLGQLSPLYVYVSNSLITPIVAVADKPMAWQPNPSEVAEVFQVPLAEFLEPQRRRSAPRQLGDQVYDVPYFDVHPTTPLWGATAMILAEYLALLAPVATR